jgi:hypothetical protein
LYIYLSIYLNPQREETDGDREEIKITDLFQKFVDLGFISSWV